MGDVEYREYLVPGVLAPFVKLIWSLTSDKEVVGPASERILPDGCVELVFHFADPFSFRFGDGQREQQPRSFVVGQMDRFLEIEPAGRVGFIAVRFFARGAYRFLPGSLETVASGVVDCAEVWKDRVEQRLDDICSAATVGARVRIVESMLVDALDHGRSRDRAVDRALELIERDFGNVRIDALASNIGVTTRQLARRFKTAVGLSPKEFARITRFGHVLRRIKHRRDESLTDTALECGYFDQAHLNHEFRAFAGMSPGELLERENVAF